MTLRLTLTHVPFGDDDQAEVIETIDIVSGGPSSKPADADDQVRIYTVTSSLTGYQATVIHNRDDGAQQLAIHALTALRTVTRRQREKKFDPNLSLAGFAEIGLPLLSATIARDFNSSPQRTPRHSPSHRRRWSAYGIGSAAE